MAKDDGVKKGEARGIDAVLAELKNKIAGALEIKPDTGYLLLVKKGSLSREERDVFISLWRRNFNDSGMLIFEVNDPAADVRAFEVAS